MRIDYRLFVAELDEGAAECHELRIENVACLQWRADTGECVNVNVNPSRQREGIATALWEKALEISPISHSAFRSESGDAFARSVGGYLPRRYG